LPARILVVDDNPVARTTIRALLDWHSFQVCGEAKMAERPSKESWSCGQIWFFSTIKMPVMNGVTAAYEIRRTSPATKIVFLTVHDAPAVANGVRLWANGFVGKSAAETELIPMLNRLLEVAGGNSSAKSAKAKPRRTAAKN
jgi:two-component system response regulator YesN